MPGKGKPFVKGDPRAGRPKGRKSDKTIELDLLTRAGKALDSAAYWENAYGRIIRGRAPHLENYLLPRLKGKPADQIELTGADRKPLSITVKVVRD